MTGKKLTLTLTALACAAVWGAASAAAITAEDGKTYTGLVVGSGDSFTGTGTENVVFEGDPDVQRSATAGGAATTTISGINNLTIKGTWKDDGSVFYTNGSGSALNVTINGNLTSDGEIPGSKPFHAMGGTITVNVGGDINLQRAGNPIFAQGNGAGDPGTINITAGGDIYVSANLGVAIGAANLNTSSANGASSSVSVSGRNVTVVSDGSAVAAYGKDWNTSVPVSNQSKVRITAQETLTLQGASAIVANNGMSGTNDASVTVEAKNIVAAGNIEASTYSSISIGANEGFENAVITGDVSASGSSTVDLNLGAGGSLTGTVTTTDSMVNLDLGEGSTWNVTGASTLTEVTGEGSLTLKDKTTTVSVAALWGNVAATFSDVTADDFTDAQAEVAEIIRVTEFAEGSALTTTIAEGDVNGAITVTQSGEGITASSASNTKLDSFGSLNVIGLLQWRHEMNDLTRRMGELRDSPEGIGSWVRVYGSEQEYGATGVRAKNTSVQVGADFDAGYGWKVGAAFSYTDTDAEMSNGTADGDMYGFALYGSWLHGSGQFVDLIAKYTRMSNDFDIGNMSGGYDNNGYSVSAEYGWNLRFNNVAFVEPQLELTYGTVTGDDFTAGNGVAIEQDDTDSFIGRIGLRGGFLFPNNKGTVYARASVLHDFDGETAFKAAKATTSGSYTDDLGGTWYEFGVGANFNLTDATYTYVDLEKTTSGEVKENWRWNVGLRHVW